MMFPLKLPLLLLLLLLFFQPATFDYPEINLKSQNSESRNNFEATKQKQGRHSSVPTSEEH